MRLSPTLYNVPGQSCRGIDEIRPHIEAVDDVPLLVPLFSGCTPASTASMIDIMQEHGRVVCCFGSSMNSFNAHAFAQADMSVAFDPLRSPVCLGMEVDSKPLLVNRGAASAPLSNAVRRTETTAEMIAAHFNTIPCSFCVSRDVDFSLGILIRESRRLSLNFRQCFSFLFYGQGTLSLVNLLSQAAMLPPIMNGLQVIWLILVPLPLVAASLLATPAEQGLMGLQTSDLSRKDGLEQRVTQYSAYFALRAVPTLCSLVALFVIVLRDACENRGHSSCHLLLGNRDHGRNGTATGTWNGRAGAEVTVSWPMQFYRLLRRHVHMSGSPFDQQLELDLTIARCASPHVYVAGSCLCPERVLLDVRAQHLHHVVQVGTANRASLPRLVPGYRSVANRNPPSMGLPRRCVPSHPLLS